MSITSESNHSQKKVSKITVPEIIAKKSRGEKIACLTAYDHLMARHLSEAEIDLILVGDSVGMVIAGYENTIPVSLDEIIYHTKAVVRGNEHALVVADMPFMSYQVNVDKAIENAGRCIKEGMAGAVKLEGGGWLTDVISHLVKIGIPVMGHLGLTPQSINTLGGYRVQAKKVEKAEELINDAVKLEEAGVFSIVLEMVPTEVAKEVTTKLSIPTIGIGAGIHCDGQILVTHDLLGIYDHFKPKFVRRYANMARDMKEAYVRYIRDVKSHRFPSEEESF